MFDSTILFKTNVDKNLLSLHVIFFEGLNYVLQNTVKTSNIYSSMLVKKLLKHI